jgi:hypothetical protein
MLKQTTHFEQVPLGTVKVIAEIEAEHQKENESVRGTKRKKLGRGVLGAPAVWERARPIGGGNKS